MLAHIVTSSSVTSSSSSSTNQETSSRFDGPWSCIPLVVFQAGLSRSAFMVYGVLSMYAGNTDICWPSLQRISQQLAMDKAQVCRALIELESRGFLQRFRVQDENGHQGNTRYLLRLPDENKKPVLDRNPSPTGSAFTATPTSDSTVTPPSDSTVTLQYRDKKQDNNTTTPTPPPQPNVVASSTSKIPVAETTEPYPSSPDRRGGGDFQSISPDEELPSRQIDDDVPAAPRPIEPAPKDPAPSAVSDPEPQSPPSAPPLPQSASPAAEPTELTPESSAAQDNNALIFPDTLSRAQILAIATLLSLVPTSDAQQILDELAGKMLRFEVYNPVGFLRVLVRNWRAGLFTAELALEVAQRREDRQRYDRIRATTERVMRARLEGAPTGASSDARTPVAKPVAHLQAMRQALASGQVAEAE